MNIKNILSALYSSLHNKFSLPENRKKLLYTAMLLLLLAGILARIAGMYFMQDHFLHNDGGDYLNISQQIAKGNGFSKSIIHWYEATPPGYNGEPMPAFHRPPVLPLLGAILYFLPFDILLSAKVAVLLTGIVCILMVYMLAKEIFNDTKTAFIAAFLYTFYPYSIYHGICYSSENLFLLFLCGAFYFLSKCIRKDLSLSYASLCGGMMALATLTRPQGFGLFLILGFTGTLVMLFRKTVRKKLFKALVFYTLGAFLLLSPWMIRNYLAAGKPTPLTFYSPYSFALAYSNISYMTHYYIDDPLYKEKADKAWNTFHTEKKAFLAQQKIYHLPDANKYWTKWAWEYIRNNPQKVCFIVWSRLLHCFRAVPNQAATTPAASHLIRLYFILLCLFFAAGICFARKNIPALLLLLSPLSVLLFAVPFLMLLRFRYPCFAPAAAIFASYGLVKLAENVFAHIRKKDKKSPSPAEDTGEGL